MISTAQHLAKMKAIYEKKGARAVLAYLNPLTEHRFTALYRFDDETLQNLYFYDRLQPEVETCEDVPVLASYCVFVRDTRAMFTLSNSLEDDRVVNHRKRLQVRSYCGVPLLDELGQMFGTICHFDPESRPISDQNVLLLESVAQLLKGTAASPVTPGG